MTTTLAFSSSPGLSFVPTTSRSRSIVASRRRRTVMAVHIQDHHYEYPYQEEEQQLQQQDDDDELFRDRRSFLASTAGGLMFLSSSSSSSSPAWASGGATAGGAYLLSAKQRYNARVVSGMKSFLALQSSLGGSDTMSLDDTKAYFTSDEEGAWKDASAAGYLLANAFRRNSTTPPDNLPAVKKWKAFAGQVEAMQKTAKRLDVKATAAAYGKALTALDEYLEEVELPPSAEL
eukprot:CAMPEP_0116576626 /NCGR_PEP_ID=MMETSP0397-20121206/20642_1 /TAXON_ID=216820 /ORGANISM="Cyclophora tenuis, Strain ECT3854" /LENGTH=232 /DNA_ID=CAMNT_0004105699 /DNA_START=65 /DNA_END=763 /DNA_ORIENTATION=+